MLKNLMITYHCEHLPFIYNIFATATRGIICRTKIIRLAWLFFISDMNMEYKQTGKARKRFTAGKMLIVVYFLKRSNFDFVYTLPSTSTQPSLPNFPHLSRRICRPFKLKLFDISVKDGFTFSEETIHPIFRL